MNAEKLKEICLNHIKWLNNEGGEKADLSRANLSGSNLYGSNISRADLSYANLSRADLYGANISRADLSYANLSGSNISRADLSSADLSHADLSGADISRADLYGANLPHKYLSIGPIGSRNCIILYSYEYNVIICGCFKGSIKEFAEKVKSTYQEGHKRRIEYDAAIDMIEKLRPLYDKK